MASKQEEALALKVHERERRESEMRNTLQNIRDMNLQCSRRLLVHQCLSWMELQTECNDLARQLNDAADAELLAPVVTTWRGKAVQL